MDDFDLTSLAAESSRLKSFGDIDDAAAADDDDGSFTTSLLAIEGVGKAGGVESTAASGSSVFCLLVFDFLSASSSLRFRPFNDLPCKAATEAAASVAKALKGKVIVKNTNDFNCVFTMLQIQNPCSNY